MPPQLRARIRPGLRTTLAAAIATAALCSPAGAGASAGCDRVASPWGSDSAPGTVQAPLRTVNALTRSLSPGQTGCLRAGSYGGQEARLEQPGSQLTSFPGESATVTTMLEVMPEARAARVHHLRFDATHYDSTAALKVQADDTVVSDNEITKGGNGICVQVATFNAARRVIIERNRIRNCGPADSKYDHQIYLQSSRDAIVRRNILTGNRGGWGVHLYSDADGTLVEHNIIDGNRGGVVFAGDGEETSDRNVVRNNAITNSGPRWNIEASWSGGPRGSGNSAHHNCLHTAGDADGGLQTEGGGFSSASNEVLRESPYVNRAAGDLRFKAGTACDRLVGDVLGASVGIASAGRARIALRSRRRRVRPGGGGPVQGPPGLARPPRRRAGEAAAALARALAHAGRAPHQLARALLHPASHGHGAQDAHLTAARRGQARGEVAHRAAARERPLTIY